MMKNITKGAYWLPFVFGAGIVLELLLVLLGEGSGLGGLPNILVMLVFFITVGGIFFLSFCYLRAGGRIRESLERTAFDIKEMGTGMGDQEILQELLGREKVFSEKRLDEAFGKFREELESIGKAGAADKYNIDTKVNIEDYINEDLVDSAVQDIFLSQIPATLTGLGIMGTFLGLSIGLNTFELSGTAAEVEANIGPLMDGIKVAFHTSICGLCFSILYNFFYRKSHAEIVEALEEFLDKFQKFVIASTDNGSANTFLKYQAIICKLLQDQTVLENQIMDRQDARFGNLARKLDEQNKQALEIYGQINKRIAESQVRGIQKVVDAFVGQMNGALRGSFEELEEMARSMRLYQKETQGSLEAGMGQICKMHANMAEMNAGLEHSVQQIRGFMDGTARMQEMLEDNLTAVRAQTELEGERIRTQSELLQGLAVREGQLAKAAQEQEERLARASQGQEERLAQMTQGQEERLAQITQDQEERLARITQGQEERLAQAAQEQEGRLARASQEQEERLAQAARAQEEWLEKAAEAQNVWLGRAVEAQEEWLGRIVAEQDERMERASAAQEERIGRAFTEQEERTRRAAEIREELAGKMAAAQEERLGKVLTEQEERLRRALEAQEERAGRLAAAQEEWLQKAAAAQEEWLGRTVAAQEERMGRTAQDQEERLGKVSEAQEERIGKALAEQEERLRRVSEAQEERLRRESQMQEERAERMAAAQEERAVKLTAALEERMAKATADLGERIGQAAEEQGRRLGASFERQEKQMESAFGSLTGSIQEQADVLIQMQKEFDFALRQGILSVSRTAEESCRALQKEYSRVNEAAEVSGEAAHRGEPGIVAAAAMGMTRNTEGDESDETHLEGMV